MPEPNPTPKAVRGWSEDYIHERLAKAKGTYPYGQSVLESELRVIESWRQPAAKSLWISLAALIISLVALYVSATKPDQSTPPTSTAGNTSAAS